MIHVCYGLHDGSGRYSKFTATAMLSLFENVSGKNSVTVHLLHDNTLTNENRERFSYMAGRYNQLIKFYNVEVSHADKLQLLREKLSEHINKRFSIGTFYRLLLCKEFFKAQDVSKIIYLDSDTIVNLDIRQLWDYSLEDYALAAVPELQATRYHMITDKFLLHSGQVRVDDYFCSGVAMLNLEKFDEDFFEQGIDWLAENPQCECCDQDILNHFFAENYLKLPEKFDAFVGVAQQMDNNTLYPKIYHYAGECIGFDMNDAYNRLFFQHFTKTAWFNEETISHFYESMRKIFDERQGFAMSVTKLMAGKQRCFFIPPENVAFVKAAFLVEDGEEVIEAASMQELPKLISAMKISNGKKVFFLLIGNYPIAARQLIQEGFVEGKDFVNAEFFLPDIRGTSINYHALIKFL